MKLRHPSSSSGGPTAFRGALGVVFGVVLCAVFTSSAWAHGGEEHSHDDAAAASTLPATLQAPRSSAESEEFELVAVLANRKLTLYLDRYASNAPVADARIELESGAVKLTAAQVEPGVYELPGERFLSPGKHALVFSIQTAETADLLAATLIVPAAAPLAAAAGEQTNSPALVWTAAGLLGALLAAFGIRMLRRRK